MRGSRAWKGGMSAKGRPYSIRVGLFLIGTVLLGYGGFGLGVAASYYLGDRGDVGSAFIAVVTCPVGIALGLLSAWFIAKWLTIKANSELLPK